MKGFDAAYYAVRVADEHCSTFSCSVSFSIFCLLVEKIAC